MILKYNLRKECILLDKNSHAIYLIQKLYQKIPFQKKLNDNTI